ncbi:MAG: JAB domain-containing protein, partial [Eubacteriales bacterium]
MKEKGIFKLEKVSVRLVKDAPLLSSVPINSPQKAVELLGQELSEMDREVVCLINLTHDMKPINCHILSIGSLNQAIVHPRELYKSSILSNAAHIILLHSHPSGNLTPSKEDIQLTTGLRKISELIQIPLLDHIIVGGG